MSISTTAGTTEHAFTKEDYPITFDHATRYRNREKPKDQKYGKDEVGKLWRDAHHALQAIEQKDTWLHAANELNRTLADKLTSRETELLRQLGSLGKPDDGKASFADGPKPRCTHKNLIEWCVFYDTNILANPERGQRLWKEFWPKLRAWIENDERDFDNNLRNREKLQKDNNEFLGLISSLNASRTTWVSTEKTLREEIESLKQHSDAQTRAGQLLEQKLAAREKDFARLDAAYDDLDGKNNINVIRIGEKWNEIHSLEAQIGRLQEELGTANKKIREETLAAEELRIQLVEVEAEARARSEELHEEAEHDRTSLLFDAAEAFENLRTAPRVEEYPE